MRKTRGFTLFELLAVVGVISVVTLAAVPQLTKARETYRLTGAANDLVGRLNNARIHGDYQKRGSSSSSHRFNDLLHRKGNSAEYLGCG